MRMNWHLHIALALARGMRGGFCEESDMAAGEVRSVWNVGAILGEGPVWVERDQALWFTDIKRQKVHRIDPASGDKQSWDAPEQVGFVFPATSGGFIAGLQSGLHRFDPASNYFERLAEVEADKPDNRLNDGVVDGQGRIWFGTMDNTEKEASGAYYRYGHGQLEVTSLTGIAITNGPAISPDGKTLYWVDTLNGPVYACDIRDDGSLGESRLFTHLDTATEGHPDGPTVDAEGSVWIGLFGGWEARRYSPAGEVLERVRFPVANITKIAFGGPDLKTAYATTAQLHLSDEALAAQPQAGDLFAFEVDVPGIASPLVAD
jgi:xylono-1,5-lactonase